MHRCKKSTRPSSNSKYKDLHNLYTSIPGIGPVNSTTFIAHFGRFENFNTVKQIQNFIGICASPFESGT
ncbi:MAG: IS110 family transposase [Candidatus Cloacimonetes bacterium]|nr:IS110 family transposase [Candidatus Cloacimonadota bacterium]